jgi:hypothetical protein
MRILIAAASLSALGMGFVAHGAEDTGRPVFADNVKASLVFREDFEPERGYPHVLRVFLRLQNVHDAAVTWTSNSISGIEAELLDKDGKPALMPPQAASFPSGDLALLVPVGSRLDWLISHGGVAVAEDAKDKYALIVGDKSWLIPKDAASEYSLRIRLRGVPWRSAREQLEEKLLIETPPTRIKIPKRKS